MKTPEERRINPQITEVDVGVRDLRKVKLYPLSLGDQLELSDLIQEALGAFFKIEEGSDASLTLFMSFIFDLVKKNIVRILQLLALDEKDMKKLMKEITGAQLDEIVSIVYENNFAVLKNLKSLFEKVTTTMPAVAKG